jgi:hypothetical protein
MSRNTWPIIVGGCYRSGTSLVRRILNAHSRIHCGPEVKFFRDFYNDYFNDPLRHLRFMTTARSILPEHELLEVFGKAFIDCHERAAARVGKSRWADKNPENLVYLEEWQRLLGDQWVFVHVVRNPLDTLASIKEMQFPLTIPAALEERIALYSRYNQNGLSFGEIHPDRYYCLFYEQLIDSPKPTLDSLLRWLGETLEPGQLAFNTFPQENGLEDPKITRTASIHSLSIRRWPTLLTVEEARTIWQETRELWALIDRDGRYTASICDVND